ncbi:MAG: hypothetical protein JWP41_3874 [Ramlibacter sp.]|nr:hypothetical protein [Ramlibacter sp.]
MRALLVFLLLAFAQAAWALERVPFAGGWVEFASLQAARAELSRDDEFIATAGPFQRAAMLGVQEAPSREGLRAGLAQVAVPWSDADAQRWQKALATIAPAFERLRIRLPETVLLVATDGSDSAHNPYTRGNAVFLPRATDGGRFTDAEVMAHELFHVLTRNDPALATRIYALFGFVPAQPLAWPAEWAEARLSNPDAPHHRHLMWLLEGDQRVAVMPVLVARRTTLQPGESFFSVMDVRLVAVEPGAAGQPTLPRRRDGQVLWQLVDKMPLYLRQLGGNTPYVFHAEETAADNFALLVSGRPVPNPLLLERLRSVLLQQVPAAPEPAVTPLPQPQATPTS